MNKDKSLLQKYYLLLIYLVFLALDCYFLYHADYGHRKYSKTVLTAFLALWFMSNTAFNVRSSPQTLSTRMLFYVMVGFTWFADVIGIFSTTFIWAACLLAYSLAYVAYVFLLIALQTNVTKILKFHFYPKKVLLPTLLVSVLAVALMHKVAGFGTSNFQLAMYAHSFVMIGVTAFTANLWGVASTSTMRPLFLLATLFMLATNSIYAIDELVYHRRHAILDVAVAITNGFSYVFLIFGLFKFLKQKR